METGDKFHRMVALLRGRRELADQFFENPTQLLAQMGLSASELNDGTPETRAGLQKARDLLNKADIKDTDDIITAIPKLTAAATNTFPQGYQVGLHPFGFTLLEKLPENIALNITAAGTVSCSFNPWDGCHTSPDG